MSDFSGLATSGNFAQSWDIKKVLGAATGGLENYLTECRKGAPHHLCQIYWQRTDMTAGTPMQGDLKKGAEELRGHLKDLIGKLPASRIGDVFYGYIVSYDFVNRENSKDIIRMNQCLV